MLRIDGITFEPPTGFAPSETLITLTPPAPAAGAARGVRPNLIVQSRPARPGAEIGLLAGETMAELSQSVGGLEKLTSVPFEFSDGTTGVLLAYDFPMAPPGAAHAAGASKGAPAGGPPPGTRMRQYHALRLDDGRLTTMTLTVGTADLTPALGESYLRALASSKRADASPAAPKKKSK